MSDGITADAKPLFDLAADLEATANAIEDNIKAAVQQTAIKTKKFWQADARKEAGNRTRGYPGSIDYTETRETAFGRVRFSAEIGPNLARYGGKTGKKGLQPSLGVLELALGNVRAKPRDSIRRAYSFAETELATGVNIAIEQTMRRYRL